jgi:hypothetical protein
MNPKILALSKQLMTVKTIEEFNLIVDTVFEVLQLDKNDYNENISKFGPKELNDVQKELNIYNSVEEVLLYIYFPSIATLNVNIFNYSQQPFVQEYKVLIYVTIYMINALAKYLNLKYNVKDFTIYYG